MALAGAVLGGRYVLDQQIGAGGHSEVWHATDTVLLRLLLAPGGIVKITDFGIAHTADSAPVTATGELVGTPGYLAPADAIESGRVQARPLSSPATQPRCLRDPKNLPPPGAR